jgi:hypothetical protein
MGILSCADVSRLPQRQMPDLQFSVNGLSTVNLISINIEWAILIVLEGAVN